MSVCECLAISHVKREQSEVIYRNEKKRASRKKRFTFYCVFFLNVSNLLPKNRNNVKNRSNPTTLERLRAAEAEFGTTIGLPKNGAAGRERV